MPEVIEAVWKIESTRLIAAIFRVTHDIGVVEEASSGRCEAPFVACFLLQLSTLVSRASGMGAASRPIEGNDVLRLLMARGEKRHERHYEVPCEARSRHRAPRGRPCSPRRGVERVERLRAAGAGDRLLRVPSSRSCMGVALHVHGEWRPHRGSSVVSASSASVRSYGIGVSRSAGWHRKR